MAIFVFISPPRSPSEFGHIVSTWPASSTFVYRDLPRCPDLNADVSSSSSFCESPSRLRYLPNTATDFDSWLPQIAVHICAHLCTVLHCTASAQCDTKSAPLNKVQDIFECQINDHSIGSQLWPAHGFNPSKQDYHVRSFPCAWHLLDPLSSGSFLSACPINVHPYSSIWHLNTAMHHHASPCITMPKAFKLPIAWLLALLKLPDQGAMRQLGVSGEESSVMKGHLASRITCGSDSNFRALQQLLV